MRMRSAPVLAFLFSCVALFAQPNPVPRISQPLIPASTAPAGQAFTLTVHGAGFVPVSVVKWSCSPLPTTFVSKTQLTASVAAQDIATAYSASITVDSGSGPLSNEVLFPIATRIPKPHFVNQVVPAFAVKNFFAGDFDNDGLQDLASWNKNRVDVLLAK